MRQTKGQITSSACYIISSRPTILGEAQLHLHADNCSGQKKNRLVMQYLAWRDLVGLNDTITSFLLVGHTKVSPDLCFGIFKQAHHRAKIGCLEDIIKLVRSSAVLNHAQLVATQHGQEVVPTYDWAQFLDTLFKQTALKGIKAMHHLTFSSLKPGVVVVKDSVTSPERALNLLWDDKWKPNAADLPPIIPPLGLSLKRRQYLYDKIREFCPPESQDLVCPCPTQAEHTTPPPTKRKHQN